MLKIKDGINSNASTATALQTARTINGTSFNGSSNITTVNWGTARTITIGNTSKSVNGSANVSWTLAEMGTFSAINTGTYWGLASPAGDDSAWIRTSSRGIIPYASTNTSALGSAGWRFANGYFNNLDADTSLNVGGASTLTGTVTLGGLVNGLNTSISIGDSSSTTYRSLKISRNYNGTAFDTYLGASSKNIKLTSSSATETIHGGAIQINVNNVAEAVYMLSNHGLVPGNDNDLYLGTSSHRWSAIYASTGTVYSSSKNEKDNIMPLNINALNENNQSIKEIINKGIKNTNMYSYSYKTLSNDDTFVGFLGQELEKQSPDFFNLIGSSYVTDEGNQQYDIRESSVIGVLWSALQDTMLENEKQESRIQELEDKLSNFNK